MNFLSVMSICFGIAIILLNWRYKLSNRYIEYSFEGYSEDIFKGSTFYRFRTLISKDHFKRMTALEVYGSGLAFMVIGILYLVIGYWSVANTMLLVSIGLAVLHFAIGIPAAYMRKSR